MTREEILDSLIESMKEIYPKSKIDFTKITESYSLKNDLGFDSISLILMALAIEEKFEVEIQYMDSSSFKTVKDVIDCIQDLKSKR